MRFIKVKTRAFLPPRDNIYDLFEKHLPKLKEGDVLFITSKVLAIHQGRCVAIDKNCKNQKDKLIMRETASFVSRRRLPGHYAILTIKQNTLIPSAGIDSSNANGYFILWPKNINQEAKKICQYLKRKYKIKKLAIIITDSHTTPLRRGTTGISIGFYGLKPVKDLRGKPDIFKQKLKITRVNVIDAIAAFGVLLMGESNERTPMLILRKAKFITFNTRNNYSQLIMHPKTDIYAPLLKVFKKRS